MTREEIRVGLQCLKMPDMLTRLGDFAFQLDAEKVDVILNYLHSQGVVIKVDRELPENPIKITHYLGLSKEEANTRQLEQDCFVQVIQDQMLLAGYIAVEEI